MPQEQDGLRLLSLDGGGIRGLSELLILEEIMGRIRFQQNLDEAPLPCDYFDIIGGTSTGGLIALMLGALGMSVKEAIASYGILSKKVFSESNRVWGGGFKASNLEHAVKGIVKDRTGHEDELMIEKGSRVRKCKTFVCTMMKLDIGPAMPQLFRTYEVPKHSTFNCTIWEAARATSAAPGYFEPIVIGEQGSATPFIDGGMSCNNPTQQVLAEARLVFPGRQVACIVSIGTGKASPIAIPKPGVLQKITLVPINAINAVTNIATSSEQIENSTAEQYRDTPGVYFRFDVEQGLQDVVLSDWERLGGVRAYTAHYMQRTEVDQKLGAAVAALLGRRKPVATSSHWSGSWKSLGGIFPPGATASAVARMPHNLDLFICGTDGRVYTSWWSGGQEWSGIGNKWVSLGGSFMPGARVSAVARMQDHLDLFVCGNNGHVYSYTSWWSGASGWSGIEHGWKSLGGWPSFPPGAHVSALARKPDNLDLFICGNDGHVYTLSWSAGHGWDGRWQSIGHSFAPGATVAAVARMPHHIDLFVCGNDGCVYTSWWSSGSGWSGVTHGWKSLGGRHFFPPGAHVSALARKPDILDLFICGNDGHVYNSWWTEGREWTGIGGRWKLLGGSFAPGAIVTAVARTPDHSDLFVCGKDGRVYTSWWSRNSGWSGINHNWKYLGGPSLPGAEVSAIARMPNSLDLFVRGKDGPVYTAWWKGM